MSRLQAREMFGLVRPVAVLQELMFLDGVWTSAIEEANDAHDPDVQVVRDIARQMDDLLVSAGEAVTELKRVFGRNRDLFGDAIAKIGTSDQLSTEQRGRWLRLLPPSGDASELLEQMLDRIEGAAPRERDDIKVKVKNLEEHGKSEGDLTAGTMCAIGGTVAVVSAASGDWILAYMAAVYAGAECAQAYPPPLSWLS